MKDKPVHSLKIGIVQMNPIVGDLPHNTAQIIRRIDEAEKRGLDWVIFSELALSGYPVWDLANKKGFIDAGLAHLKKITRATRGKKVMAILGFIDRGPAGSHKAYNALAVLSNGKVIHKQYKSLLPTYDVFLEQIFFEPARDQKIFTYQGLKVGTTICEDLWDEQYPLKPMKVLAQKGARVIVNISASPYHGRVEQVRDALIRKKSRETGAYFIYVNQVGGQDDLIFDGCSLVASPDGEVLFRGEPFRENLYEVKLDIPRKTVKRKSAVRVKQPERRLGCGDAGEMYRALCLGVRDYVRKNGFKRVVIGLSGGIDSALTAAIAVDALGPEAVIGVAMPGEFSSEDSLRDARELARHLKIEFRVHPITKKYHQFLKEAKKGAATGCLSGGRPPGLPAPGDRPGDRLVTPAMENLQARLRGMELMYISNDEGAMLLSTGNKSELATGYCTLYGDMSGGLCVLGDVYKTDVYRLAAYRNGQASVIPAAIIRKAPTAELRPNQKDQDSLPPYDVLDTVLYQYIEENRSREEIIRKVAGRSPAPIRAGRGWRLGRIGAGRSPAPIWTGRQIKSDVVRDIIHRVECNEYKRRQAPPILRVTEKAWFGRRMPITNHFRG